MYGLIFEKRWYRNMTLQNLKEILLTIMDDVHHLDSPKGAEPPYIVWAEDGEA